MNRQKYQIFTPTRTVTNMLDSIGYDGQSIIAKKIIDISCGDGAFLRIALQRLIVACQNRGLNKREIAKICSDNIWGVELDPNFYADCIKNLNIIIRKRLGINYIKWNNISNSNGLLLREKGFDFVVGNPPYISYKEMTNEQRLFLSENFQSCKSGRFDYSFAFIEKSISILSSNGKGCVISPINMYKIKSGMVLKEIIRPLIVEIIDVTEDNIFKGVLTNPVISVFQSNATGNILIKKKGRANRSVDRATFENAIVPYSSFGTKRFGDHFEVHNGIATLLNEAFLINCDSSIETSLLKDARSPKFERYNIRKKIIFPYISTKEGTIKRISEEKLKTQYKETYEHLLSFKDRLVKRDISYGTMWFEYGRVQAIDKMAKRKIMIPAIMSEGIKPVLLDENGVVFAGFYIIEKNPHEHPLEEAMEILTNNSKLYKYIKNVGVKMSGNSYRYSARLLEDFLYD